MHKMFLKYKILVNGFSPGDNYSIDDFIMKTGTFEQKLFDNQYNSKLPGINLNMNLYLYSCVNDDKNLTYNYLESKEFVEIEFPYEVTKEKVQEFMQSDKAIVGKVTDLEKKMRIKLNIPIFFQIFNIEFYDESQMIANVIQVLRPISNWNRIMYGLPAHEIINNDRFEMDFDSMKNTNNLNFNRAIEFYNDSFDSEKRSNRFILIFTSLEAIFNLGAKGIKRKLAKYSAKLLAEGNEIQYKEIEDDIKRLYKKRSEFIHGSKKTDIEDDDEKLLRRYVRKIIIAYWLIVLRTNKTAEEILLYLDSPQKLDLQTRMCIAALNANDFTEQQHKLINLLENETRKELPEETKKTFLSKCKDTRT